MSKFKLMYFLLFCSIMLSAQTVNSGIDVANKPNAFIFMADLFHCVSGTEIPDLRKAGKTNGTCPYLKTDKDFIN